LVEKLDNEIQSIRKEILKFCWYMRGGLTYEEALNLSGQERQFVADLIAENLETTKKTQLPFF